MNSTGKQLQTQINTQYGVNNGLAPNLGNIAQWYAQNNPASYMVDPDWYYRNQAAGEAGIGGAQAQQGAMANQNDQYDAAANRFDQFANGVGGQLQPGLDAQQQNANKQQSQADWMWQNPGYTDQEKQAMGVATATPIAGAYSAASEDLRNTAARTGNSASYGAQAADLARQKSQDMAMSGLNQQGMFAQQRIAGQQAANAAQGQAGQAQGNVNQNVQAGQGLQNSIFNTGAGIRQGGSNMRIGTAGSNLQTANTAQQGQQVQQGAGALSMAPANLAAGMYGTTQNALTGAMGAQNTLSANNPGFLKTLGQGLAGGLGAMGSAAIGLAKPVPPG